MTEKDLTSGSVRTHLINMTVPMVWGILAIMFMNIVDTFYVGQLGTDPLAAMGFAMPVLSILLALAFGIGIGTSSVIARDIGANRPDAVRSHATQGIFIGLAIALSFAIFGTQSIDWIFKSLGAPDHLMPLIHDYMDVWFLGSFVVVIPMVGNSAIRAAGNTKVPSVVMISVAVVNVILDPILIFGLFGFPRLELAGAALATVISYSIALIIGLYFLIVKLKFLTLSACTQRVWVSWKAILKIGIPAVGTNLIAPLSVAITTRFIAGFGPDAVAGFGVASRIESFCIVTLMALSSITGPFVGQNWGANRIDRVQEGLKLSFKFVALWSGGVAVLMWLFAPQIVALFSEGGTVQTSAITYLYWVPITYIFLGMVMVSSSAGNGTGNPTPALVMSLMRLIIIFIPLALFLMSSFELQGIYVAIALSNLIVGLGAWWWAKGLGAKTVST